MLWLRGVLPLSLRPLHSFIDMLQTPLSLSTQGSKRRRAAASPRDGSEDEHTRLKRRRVEKTKNIEESNKSSSNNGNNRAHDKASAVSHAGSPSLVAFRSNGTDGVLRRHAGDALLLKLPLLLCQTKKERQQRLTLPFFLPLLYVSRGDRCAWHCCHHPVPSIRYARLHAGAACNPRVAYSRPERDTGEHAVQFTA